MNLFSLRKNVYVATQVLKTTIKDFLYFKESKEEKYFCLSAGNSGSKYLVELLKTNDIKRCYHEYQPDLDKLAVQYYLNGTNRQLIKFILKHTRKKVFFESSNRLFSVAELIKEVYPKSKFIILVRNPKKFIISSVNKTIWPEVWKSKRLRYSSELGGNVTLPPFERTCHYWNNYYERILRDLRNEEALLIHFEDLIKGEIDTLERFMDLKILKRIIDPVNTKEHIKSNVKKIGNFDTWAIEQKEAFERICGKTMKTLGYE